MFNTLTISTIDKNILILLQYNDIIDRIIIEEENRQAELLVPNIEKILKKNNIWYDNLNYISVINGPGSFIGLKVAIAVVKAIKCIYNNINIIANNVFEVLSFNKKYDFVILKADINGYYLYDTTKNIKYVNSEYLKTIDKNKIIISNVKNIVDFLNNDNIFIDNISIENLLLLNNYKCENNIFSNNIEAFYIMNPKINKRKNEQ